CVKILSVSECVSKNFNQSNLDKFLKLVIEFDITTFVNAILTCSCLEASSTSTPLSRINFSNHTNGDVAVLAVARVFEINREINAGVKGGGSVMNCNTKVFVVLLSFSLKRVAH